MLLVDAVAVATMTIYSLHVTSRWNTTAVFFKRLSTAEICRAQDSSVDQLVRQRPGCLLRSSDPDAELRYLVEACIQPLKLSLGAGFRDLTSFKIRFVEPWS